MLPDSAIPLYNCQPCAIRLFLSPFTIVYPVLSVSAITLYNCLPCSTSLWYLPNCLPYATSLCYPSYICLHCAISLCYSPSYLTNPDAICLGYPHRRLSRVSTLYHQSLLFFSLICAIILCYLHNNCGTVSAILSLHLSAHPLVSSN